MNVRGEVPEEPYALPLGKGVIEREGKDVTIVALQITVGMALKAAEELEKQGELLLKKEGKQGFNWILLDYSDVIVHIFYQETREFYGLEKLWSDAEELSLSEIIGENTEED